MPYREAKVCYLFRDVLHGWGRILLSVNVSPCACDYDETSHVLKVGPSHPMASVTCARPQSNMQLGVWVSHLHVMYLDFHVPVLQATL